MSYVAPPPGTTLEVRWLNPTTGTVDLQRGVIIHAAMTWFLAYFPGSLDNLVTPADPQAIRVVDFAEVTSYRDLPDCEPEWVTRTWEYVQRCGPGLLQSPVATRVWALAADLAQARLDRELTLSFTREQVEDWAGRPLSDDEVNRLEDAIPNSSIPDAVGEIVASMDED